MNVMVKQTPSSALAGVPLGQISQRLKRDGYLLLHHDHFDIEAFSRLIKQLCHNLTFDPAREYASDAAQTVDAGTAAVGLHIENGNTPLPPDVVSFYSAKSASHGAQTTVCDGAAVLNDMPASLVKDFQRPFSMTRYLPQVIWQRYVASAFGIDDPQSVDLGMLEQFIAALEGQSFQLGPEGGIHYRLEIPAIRSDNIAGLPAFANALLGPSYNYETPVYRFASGEIITDDVLAELATLGERHTREISWRDGDVAIIDNKRVMHGRREITVPLAERTLYIAMGLDVICPEIHA